MAAVHENVKRPRGDIGAMTPVTIRNILFATDFSTASERALNYALAVARRYEARIHAVHIIRPDSFQMLPPDALTATRALIRRSAEEEMADLLVSGRFRGIAHQALVEEGELWSVLSGIIERNAIDLLVLGTHGRTGVQKVLLGSVAERVFRLAECPVLTVGPTVTDQAPEEEDFHSILFATNFTPTSERALAYALSLAQEHQARLTLLHAVQDLDNVSPRSIETLRQFFLRRLEKLVPPGTDLWCEPEFVVTFGSPVESILQEATDTNADLIVLGIRGTSPLGHLPPAKAYRIVSEADCPVLTVRGNGRKKPEDGH
jgi:nucleotide-binding universal stress UspA family protein